MANFRFNGFSLDAGKRLLERSGEEIELQPKVFETLLYLVRNAERVVAKSELLDAVWPGVAVTENVLARAISTLRKALDDSPRESRYIRAVPRVGYRFVASVDTSAPVDSDTSGCKAIAVLPFQPLSTENRDEALELGIADALAEQLSRLPDLVVRPLSTVQQVAAECSDPFVVAERTSVDACLDGTIQRRGDRVRLTARLHSAKTQAILWSASFDEEMADIFKLQDQICRRIVRELTPRLAAFGSKRRETSPEAYKSYLEGRLFLNRFVPLDVSKALTHFEAALDEDPAYAPAWAGVGECHEFFGTMGADAGNHYAAAARASKRALALDPDSPDALCMLAKIAWQFDWNWQRAEALFEDAVSRFPNRADLHISYSDYCCYLGLPDRSIEQARAALAIDPISPWVNTLLGQALHMSGSHDEAVRQLKWTLELSPGFSFAHFFLGLTLFAKGELDTALAELETAVRSGRPDFVAAFGFLLGVSGQKEASQKILDDVLAAGDQAPPIAKVLLYLGQGNSDAARNATRECIEKRDWHLLILTAEPAVAILAKDAGLTPLLDTLRLPGDRSGTYPERAN